MDACNGTIPSRRCSQLYGHRDIRHNLKLRR